MLAFLTLIFSGFYLNRRTFLIPRQTGNSHDYSPQSIMRDWQNLQFNSEITHLVCTEKSDCEKWKKCTHVFQSRHGNHQENPLT